MTGRIILIGMPAGGKTTIGAALSRAPAAGVPATGRGRARPMRQTGRGRSVTSKEPSTGGLAVTFPEC